MLRVAAFLALATSAHGYSFSNPVANEESVLVAAQNITVLAAAADFAGAKAAYENSGVLKTLASTDETGDVTFDVYKAYFGGASGVHETTLLACLDGTGAWAVGTGEAANVKDDARKEYVALTSTTRNPTPPRRCASSTTRAQERARARPCLSSRQARPRPQLRTPRRTTTRALALSCACCLARPRGDAHQMHREAHDGRHPIPPHARQPEQGHRPG